MIHLDLDRTARAIGRRMAHDLWNRYRGEVPVAALMLAAEAFRAGSLRALRDRKVAGDHAGIVARLLESWSTAVAVEFRRLARSRRDGAPA